MTIEIKVPTLGESVSEATVAKWLKKVGDSVAADEPLLELETDKVTLEVNAPAAGTLSEILAAEGAEVGVGVVLGLLGAAGAAVAPKKAEAAKPAAPAPAAAAAAPVVAKAAAPAPKPVAPAPAAAPKVSMAGDFPLAPSVRHLVDEHGLDPRKISASGKDGRLTKADVIGYIANGGDKAVKPSVPNNVAREERVKMTRLRKRIAERLKEAQNTAAMLTTFNEVDMSAVMAMRNKYKDGFEKKHGIKMGFMSFFVKACVTALKELPAVNGEIRGDELIYKNFYDVGVAVGTPQGLVVPVVRDCDTKSFAEIEAEISGFGRKARDGKLTIEEMTGGSFTISNGGIYGSMLSTPILNTPQSAILGMHNIKQRAVVLDGGSIVARPMMYLALSYDHRIIDGREAVTFLVRVKEGLEDPSRLVLDM
ncbi:MAG: 2-oxoglutarate dehydrogenase complex dihydrolipoyllysine-residue succinyltransferase [Alphaproteobacteria bacterium]|nr:2-oxoglutarate dehydrogenase complex dihydrolipoyllysine-residue succinyltransferase [Alphaproteobacteria bacterium]PHY00978.1 MAG: dihydrolipoyllysine-residue succinyltransferase [Rhodospirillaceae bacterium]